MTQKDKDFITELLAQKQTKSTFNNDNARVLFDWGVKIGVIVITFYIIPLSTKVSELRDFMIGQQSNNQIMSDAVKEFRSFMNKDFYDVKDHESNIEPVMNFKETSDRIDKKQEQIIKLLATEK